MEKWCLTVPNVRKVAIVQLMDLLPRFLVQMALTVRKAQFFRNGVRLGFIALMLRRKSLVPVATIVPTLVLALHHATLAIIAQVTTIVH